MGKEGEKKGRREVNGCNASVIITTLQQTIIMPRWPANAKKFKVSIIHNVQRDTSYSYIPKPILAKLGNPKGLQFVIRGDKIIVTRPD